MISSLLVFLLLVSGITHLSYESLYSTTDNNGIIQKVSQYLFTCCDPVNLGKTFIFEKGNGVTSFILCKPTLPDNCPVIKSCSDILLNTPDATSGYHNLSYHTMTNGSIISAYCDMEGNNCGGEGAPLDFIELYIK